MKILFLCVLLKNTNPLKKKPFSCLLIIVKYVSTGHYGYWYTAACYGGGGHHLCMSDQIWNLGLYVPDY